MGGKVGPPLGSKNASKNRPWAEALRKHAIQRGTLDKVAQKVCLLAEQGDMDAIKEIGDRLDGKPKASMEHTGADGGPIKHLIDVLYDMPEPPSE